MDPAARMRCNHGVMQNATAMRAMGATATACLLHDTGLALGECDVATRFVLDELDFDFSPLATGLVFVVVIFFHLFVRARTLDAAVCVASSERGIAIAGDLIVVAWRSVLVVLGDFGGHDLAARTNAVLCLTLTLWGSVWRFSLLKGFGGGRCRSQSWGG